MNAKGEAGDAGPARDESAAERAAQEESAIEPETPLDPRLDRLIGRSLEAHYEDILSAPLPDKFLVLLAQLEASEKLETSEKKE